MEHSHQHGHSHDHGHDHSHGLGLGHHHHTVDVKDVNRAFIIGIILNFAFVLIEAIVGLNIKSLSLLSDAGHNLADVASLAMSLMAFRLLKVRPNERYTYGYKKTTILVALLNAAILLLSLGAIVYEAIHRLMQPEPLPGKTISIVAAIGIVVNAVTALLFFRSKESDLNIKSAFLHLMSDAIVSAGLVVGGIIIFYTHLYWIDAALSLLVAVIILFSVVEGWIDRVNQIRNYKIVCTFENETLHKYEDLFRSHHLSFKRSRQSKTSTEIIAGEWVVQGTEQNHRHCIHEILRDPSVKAFEF